MNPCSFRKFTSKAQKFRVDEQTIGASDGVKKILHLVIFSLCFMLCLYQIVFASRDIIKVGIIKDVPGFNVSGNNYYVYEIKSGKKRTFNDSNDYLARIRKDSLLIDGKGYNLPVRLVPVGDEHVKINGRRYRDSILILKTSNGLNVINELGIDNYIRGVLPKEMSPSWPPEALKAQAVAARSFVWKNSGRHRADGFDVCSTVHCQVYGGLEVENPATDRAVFETKGEVLYDRKGEVVNAVYHASCGGHTEEIANVWNMTNEIPHYFVPRVCKFCTHYKHFNWTHVFDGELIRKKMYVSGYKVGKIKNLEIVGRSVSGRAKHIRVSHTAGKTLIHAGKFRLALDPWRMRSTKLTAVVRHKDSFEFRGSGWGHGVGLCQAGAKGMADEGRDYVQILKFYYPGTVVRRAIDSE